MTKPKKVAVAGQLGSVEAYMLARVTPEPGQQVTCSVVFEDYRTWCEREMFAPLREDQFVAIFEDVARAAGIPLRQRGSNLSFLDTVLRDAAH